MLRFFVKSIIANFILFSSKFLFFLKSFNSKNSKNIIFIDLSLIGDVFLSFPYYKKIIENMEKEKRQIKIICLPSTAELFNKIFENVVIFDPKKINLKKPISFIKFCAKFDLSESCIISHTNNLDIMNLLCLSLWSKNKIMYSGEGIEKKEFHLFSKKIDVIEPYKGFNNNYIINHINHYFSCLSERLSKNEKIKIEMEDYKKIFFEIISKEDKDRILRKFNLFEKKYSVVLDESSMKSKRYDHWQEIVDFLVENGETVIKLGIEENKIEKAINLSGKTSLIEAMAIIYCSSFCFGNDTGLVIFSYLLGIPTVCVLGGWQFGRIFPEKDCKNLKIVYSKMECFNCNWDCKYANISAGETPPCISKIKPIEILKKFNEIGNEKK